MKKIKTINKLLSSLTLLSPLAGIGFNNQYQNTQKVITENFKNSLNSFTSSNTETQMGDIYVNLDETGKIIQSYASGKGDLVIPDYVTQIANNAFYSNQNISSLDLSQATSLTSIGDSAFYSCIKLSGNIILPDSLTTISDFVFSKCPNLTGNLVIPSSVTSIGNQAFRDTDITSLDLSQATSLITIGEYAFNSCKNLTGDLVIPSSVTNIGASAFFGVTLDNLYFLSETPPTSFGTDWQPTITGKVYVPQGTTNTYLDAPDFTFNSSQVAEWSFNSSSANINGNFNQINISTTDIGSSSSAFSVTGCNPEILSNYIFTWSLVPTGETQSIPGGLSISKGKINWKNVPKGTYTFKIESSFNGWTKESDQIITINVYANTAQVQGETLIYTNQSGRKTYTFVSDPVGLVADQWEIIMDQGEKPPWLDINQNGLLTWIDISSHSSVVGKHSFKVKATNTATSLSAELPVVLNIYDKTAAIKGPYEINSKKVAGQEQYTFESFPEELSIDQWEIVMIEGDRPEWLSINEQGLLSWTDQCIIGTYKMKIRATNDYSGLQFEKEVTLIIQNVNLALILGLLIGLGIPVILAIAFIIWSLIRKKKTTVKI